MFVNSKQRFKLACNGQPVDRPPVWIMRQAGRTLPEYRALKEIHDFKELMSTPELAAEVTLQPVRRFPLDAAIIFSDILVVPEAMGLELEFSPKLFLSPSVRSKIDVDALRVTGAAESLEYVIKAIELVRKELVDEKAVLGFSGAPYTVASYMIEGGSSKSYSHLKSFMYREPSLFDRLLNAVTDVTVDYLLMQVEAGVDAVQLFDSWAGELSPADYSIYALPYVQRIIERVQATGTPVIYYINGVGNILEEACNSGAKIMGIDWRISLTDVRARLGSDIVLQGNLDPGLLFALPDEIRRRTNAMINETAGLRHIANLGHGVVPETPLEGIEAFITSVISWKRVNDR